MIAVILHLKIEDTFSENLIAVENLITLFIVFLFSIIIQTKEKSASKKEKGKTNYKKKILCVTLPSKIIALIIHIVYSIHYAMTHRDETNSQTTNNIQRGTNPRKARNQSANDDEEFVKRANRLLAGLVSLQGERNPTPNSSIENFHIESHNEGLLLYADGQDKATILRVLHSKQQNQESRLSSCILCQQEDLLPKYILRIHHSYLNHNHAGQKTHCLNHKDGYCVKCLNDVHNLSYLIPDELLCAHCNNVNFPFELGSHRLNASKTAVLIISFFLQEEGQNLLKEYDQLYPDN